ncbi:hypothetical protein Tco_0657708 [Tanacetum coccineum]
MDSQYYSEGLFLGYPFRSLEYLHTPSNLERKKHSTYTELLQLLPNARHTQEFTDYENLDKCLEYIEELTIMHVPIDGLAGFSQNCITGYYPGRDRFDNWKQNCSEVTECKEKDIIVTTRLPRKMPYDYEMEYTAMGVTKKSKIGDMFRHSSCTDVGSSSSKLPLNMNPMHESLSPIHMDIWKRNIRLRHLEEVLTEGVELQSKFILRRPEVSNM